MSDKQKYEKPTVTQMSDESVAKLGLPTLDRHFNGLTPAEAERLAMLIEECGEVIQAATKILRHGYESYHPAQVDPKHRITNRDDLRRELLDLNAVHIMMLVEGDMKEVPSADAVGVAQQKLRYTHHQKKF